MFEELYNYSYYELIDYLKKLSKEERLELLKDQRFLKKIFLLDGQESIIQNFYYLLEVYTFKDLYLYIDSKLIKEMELIHKENSYYYLMAFLIKDPNIFQEYIFVNQDLLNTFIEKSDNYSYALKFDYDICLKFIKYASSKIFSYNEKFNELVMKFKHDFLNKNQTLIETNIIIDKMINQIVLNKGKFEIVDINQYVIDLWYDSIESLIKTQMITRENLKKMTFQDDLKLFLNSLINFLTNVSSRLDDIKNNSLFNSERFIFFISNNSIRDLDLQRKMLNEDLSNQVKRILLRSFGGKVAVSYINKNLIYVSNQDLYAFLCQNGSRILPNLYETKSFFIDIILDTNLTNMQNKIDKLDDLVNSLYFKDLEDEMFIKIISLYNKDTKIISYYENYLEKEAQEPYEVFLSRYKLRYPDKDLVSLSRKILGNIVIEKLFQDSLKNICMNISEMLHYNASLDKSLLTSSKIKFYEFILNIFELNSDQILDFYYKYQDYDIISEFYDDITNLKRKSYQELKDSCLKISDISNMKKFNLSNKYGVDVYEFNGESFKALVSCLSHVQLDLNAYRRNCYSLISDKNMKVFLEKGIIFGYSEFDSSNILHVYEADSYSSEYIDIGGSTFINRIRKPEEILSSNLMNEIQMVNDFQEEFNGKKVYQRVAPSYIVCFDEIDSKSLEAAKERNLPIVKINREKYQNRSLNASYLEGGRQESYYLPSLRTKGEEDNFRGKSF